MIHLHSLRTLYRLGLLFYAVQLIFALVFYKERTVFIDAAFHLFEIARDGNVAIQNYRFGAAFTQAFPIAGVAAGASLTALMMAYSAAFVVLHGLAYWLCGTVLRAPRVALVLLIADSLFATDTFFWIQSELPQGLAMACVLFALAERENMLDGVLTGAGIGLLSLTVAFMHPLLIFPVVFWGGYRLAQRPGADTRNRLLVLLGCYLVSAFVKTTFFKTSYDSGAMDGLENFRLYFPDYFHLYANKRLLMRIVGPYVLLPVAAFAVVRWGVQRRAWSRLALVALFVLGYGLLIHVSYPGPETQSFYIENMYLPLGVMLGVPIVYDVLPDARSARWPQLALAVMLVFATARFVAASVPFAKRVAWVRTLVEKTGDRKLVISTSAAPMDLLKMEWGTPYEVWLLSTSERGRSSSIVVTGEPQKFTEWMPMTSHFLGTWGPVPYAELPRAYFRFADTLHGYEAGR